MAYNGLKKTLPHIIMIRKSFHEWKENKKGFVIKLYKKIMRWVIKLSYFSISLATLNYVFLIDLDLAITNLLVFCVLIFNISYLVNMLSIFPQPWMWNSKVCILLKIVYFLPIISTEKPDYDDSWFVLIIKGKHFERII